MDLKIYGGDFNENVTSKYHFALSLSDKSFAVILSRSLLPILAKYPKTKLERAVTK